MGAHLVLILGCVLLLQQAALGHSSHFLFSLLSLTLLLLVPPSHPFIDVSVFKLISLLALGRHHISILRYRRKLWGFQEVTKLLDDNFSESAYAQEYIARK